MLEKRGAPRMTVRKEEEESQRAWRHTASSGVTSSSSSSRHWKPIISGRQTAEHRALRQPAGWCGVGRAPAPFAGRSAPRSDPRSESSSLRAAEVCSSASSSHAAGCSPVGLAPASRPANVLLDVGPSRENSWPGRPTSPSPSRSIPVASSRALICFSSRDPTGGKAGRVEDPTEG